MRTHGLQLSVHHYPIDRAVELQNLLERGVPFIASNRQEIGAKAAPNPSKRIFLAQRSRRIDRYHFQDLIGRNSGLTAPKRAHLVEQAQAVVTRQAICAQANVESKRAQFFEWKSAVLEIIVAARRMHYVKSSLQSLEQIEVALN